MPQNNSTQQPLVAIKCFVFNHEPYLRQCLDGFVMQQTDFPFVAIVHDDASTDRSADIIREYAGRYPDIIRPIYETENQYSKGSLGRVMDAAVDVTGAKYIALCEGDDYWTAPDKLQKQVDFLESHKEYTLCFHKVNTFIQETGKITDEAIVKDMPGESTIVDLAMGNYIHTPSVVYRNLMKIKQDKAKCGTLPVGDYTLWMICAKYGKIYKLSDAMGVYRLGSGHWSTKSDFYRRVVWLSVLNRLRILILDNEEAVAAIDVQISKTQKSILQTHQLLESQFDQICSSYAYRVGKFILKPFSSVRKFLSK